MDVLFGVDMILSPEAQHRPAIVVDHLLSLSSCDDKWNNATSQTQVKAGRNEILMSLPFGKATWDWEHCSNFVSGN